MSEMLERAARALCVDNGVDPDKLDAGGEPLWIAWKRSARAVLQAVREPSEGMVDAGGYLCSGCENLKRWNAINNAERKFSVGYATEVYQAMLDAALSE